MVGIHSFAVIVVVMSVQLSGGRIHQALAPRSQTRPDSLQQHRMQSHVHQCHWPSNSTRQLKPWPRAAAAQRATSQYVRNANTRQFSRSALELSSVATRESRVLRQRRFLSTTNSSCQAPNLALKQTRLAVTSAQVKAAQLFFGHNLWKQMGMKRL